MAGDDAESTRSAPEDIESPEAEAGKVNRRQRAADLFSAHRYRELQRAMFERRGFRSSREDGVADANADKVKNAFTPEGFAPEDDAVDPPLDSAAPAAVAARADLDGEPLHEHHDILSPVDAGEPGVDDAAVDGAPEHAAHPWPEAEDTTDFGRPDEDFVIGEDFTPEAIAAAPHTGEWSAEDVARAGDDAAQTPTEPLVTIADGDAEAHGERGVGEDSVPASGGRNLPVATGVGVALLALAVGAAWFHPLVFAGVLYAFVVGAVIEWSRALARHGRSIPVVPLVAATLGMGVATWFAKPEGLVVAMLIGSAGVVAWRLGDERVENTLADSLAGVLTLLWIPFLGSFLFLLELADEGWMRVVVVVLAVVGNDTGGLVAGMLWGKHKLLERVSPKKTWEGAVGGAVLGTAAASVAAYFFFDGEWYIGAAVGFASTVAAVIGDLAESALKRDIHIKDMSSALPGHGGILDRIDSLLFAAPVGYVVFAIFLGTLGGGGL